MPQKGSRTESRAVSSKRRRYSIGDGHLLDATDIPHWDNEFPENLHALLNHPRVPEASKTRILHDDAAQLYGLHATDG